MRAPLHKPLRSVFGIGRNYRAHAAELAGSVFRASLPAEDVWPIVFTKLADCVIGPHDPVRLPGAAITSQIDYESELAVVIGRGGRDISRSRAMDHVFGYTVVNDVSARRAGAPSAVGPRQELRHLLPDGAVDHQRRRARRPRHADSRLGQRRAAPGREHDRHDLRHPDPDRDVLARHHALPGDVIATGTPSGVGMGFTPPRWLAAGDVVRVEIDGIGAIENTFQ